MHTPTSMAANAKGFRVKVIYCTWDRVCIKSLFFQKKGSDLLKISKNGSKSNKSSVFCAYFIFFSKEKLLKNQEEIESQWPFLFK